MRDFLANLWSFLAEPFQEQPPRRTQQQMLDDQMIALGQLKAVDVGLGRLEVQMAELKDRLDRLERKP